VRTEEELGEGSALSRRGLTRRSQSSGCMREVRKKMRVSAVVRHGVVGGVYV
jgi:hypothetical protein